MIHFILMQKTPSFLLLICCLFFSLQTKSQTEGIAKSSDSAPIYYRTFGEGKPILIINGGPGLNSNGFENLAKRLSSHHKTIIYDQRGTGKSMLKVLDSTTITMKLMVDDMESLRKHLKIKKWIILGHSFGGIMASYYATQYPERVEAIIYSASGGIDLGLLSYVGETVNEKLSQQERDSLAYWSEKVEAGDTTHYAKLQRGRFLAPAYLYDKKFVPALAERLTQGNMELNGLVWDDLARIKYDCSEKLSSFKQPVLIIQGKQDVIKAATAEKAHKVLKNSKLVFMENCGHYGWLDNEKVYFGEINDFLAKIK
jgi:proline iminopeptidase